MSIRPTPDRQPPESRQRRHLTVMFCDVVGATRLSDERDVEAYFSILQSYYEACQPVVECHGGLIAQHQGDGIYVWFGYPLPRDDDTTRAVRAGLELLVALRTLSASLEAEIGEPLAVRIAVHAGEVLVAPVAGEPSPLAFGHTPNLAAKLQQAARPGTLVVSAAVLRLIRNSFEVTIREADAMAGGPVTPVYEVVKERQREGRVFGEWRTPIVDRDAERARLQGIWASVQAGAGAAVALVGGRGMGKTRLASTVLTLARSAQATVLDCACNQLEASTAYRPFRTLLAQAATIEPGDPALAAAALLRAHLVDQLCMDELAPTLFATVLALSPAVAGPALDLDPSKLAELTSSLLVEWVHRLASAPTVVLIDDVTDADPSTLTVLAELAADVPPRLLLVFTARSDVAPPPFLAGDTIEIIEVTPLPHEVCKTLIDAVTTGSPLALPDRQRVLAQGEGIPLYLEELARATQEGLHQTGLPITLAGHLQARLVAPGIDREVAGVLAVAGRDLDATVLASVLGEDPAKVHDRLDGLLARELVVHTGGSCSSYRFRHGLITEAAYGLLLRERRTRLHSSLADALTQRHAEGHPVDWNVVGKHLKLAGRPLEAYEAILTGANEASQAGAFQEALHGYRDALDILADIPDQDTRDLLEIRCRPQKGRTIVAAVGYGFEEAVQDFDRCAALCRRLGSRPEHLPVKFGTLSFYITRGDFSTARRIAEDIQSIIDKGHADHYGTEHTAFMAHLTLYEGDYQVAGELFSIAEDQFTSRPRNDHVEENWLLPHDVAAATLAHQAVLHWIAGRPREGHDAGERAMARAATLGFPRGPFSMAFVKSYLGWIDALVGHHEGAARFARDVRDIGQKHGFALWESIGEVHLALAEYRISGRADAADAVAQHAATWKLIYARYFLPYVLTAEADTRAAMGQQAEALAGFAAAGALTQETGLYFYEAERLRLLGRALPAGAEPLTLLHQAWELAHRQGALLFEMRAALELTRLTAEPRWAQRLAALVLRFPSGGEYPEINEARTLLAHAASRQ